MDNLIQDQVELVHETGFDYLIILDALRWDTMNHLYDEFFESSDRFDKTWSPATNTLAWISQTFPDEYNITYVSGHALVNSEGVIGHSSLRDRVDAINGDHEYNPADHFETIVDVWDWGYDEDIETVPPATVMTEVRNRGRGVNNPIIGHVMQPHFPLVAPPDIQGSDPREASDQFGQAPQWTRGRVQSMFGDKGLQRAYLENARAALEAVTNTLPDLNGNVILTSDHGWYLSGDLYHPPGSEDPTLREVPWIVNPIPRT